MRNSTASWLFGKLRELRLHRGLSQEAFAEESQISYKYYQALEAGRKVDLRLSTLERLARAHGLEVWELLVPHAAALTLAETQAKYRTPRRRRRKEK